VVIVFNDLNLLVLFVFVFMKVFFLLKKHERAGKNYPTSFRKTFKVDKKYPFYKTESNFDAICVKAYVFFF
jgi:hypothetical protein